MNSLTSLHLKNARIATQTDQGIIDGDVLITDGVIAAVGQELAADSAEVIDCNGRLVTPGLIDCHTHLVYGGHRAREFELRLEGASYEELAKAGGGILSTVKHTRDASEDELYAQSLPRLQAFIDEGITTVEIKSGYGLDTNTELKMLRVARRLGAENPITVKTTLLGAHALPPEYADNPDGYIDLVMNEMIPAVTQHNLADAVDVFCEGIGFTPAQTERVFKAAQDHNLPVKIHAEQLSNLHGAQLAAEKFQALSADHLEYLDEAGVMAMKAAGTVAVLLPGAYYFLRDTNLPPIDLLRKHQVQMAVATDCNPGSSPMNSLLLAMNMGCTLFRLTPSETLAGVTQHAARALGLSDRGQIKPGMRADVNIWDVDDAAILSYRFGFNPLWMRIWNGQKSNP